MDAFNPVTVHSVILAEPVLCIIGAEDIQEMKTEDAGVAGQPRAVGVLYAVNVDSVFNMDA